MEVKKGYKQTEIGVIPDDWDIKSVNTIAEIIGGGTPNTTVPEYWNGQIHWVSAGDVSNANGRYIRNTAYLISELGLVSCSARIMPAGTTIIIARGATVGRMAQLGMEMAFNQTCYGFLPASGLDKNYLYYSMLFSVSSISALTYGTTFGTITTNSFAQWKIPIPALSEQCAIAVALSDVDALLAALDALIAKKRNIKQGAMQELLTGKKRLPGFSGEWKWKTFGDVMSNCFSGATPSRSRPDFYKGNIRWITSSELNYNVITDTVEKITVEAVDKTNLKILPKNTFLMAITGLEAEGTRGSCGIVGEEATTNQSCMALFPTNELLVEYLFHYYVFAGKKLALQYCQGTKQQSYTAQTVKLLPIYLPPTPEQQAIAEILLDMDTEIAALEQRREKTRLLKQGMMQELLTGRIRLL